MASIKGRKDIFETIGSSVQLGDHKEKSPIGAVVKFHDTENVGHRYLFGGTIFGDFVSARSISGDGHHTGEVRYKKKSQNEPKYSMRVSATSEPIDTHPKFIKEIGGTIDAPLHQAIYADDATFEKFPAFYKQTQDGELPEENAQRKKAKWDDQNRMGGVESYLNASAVWTKEYVQRNTPTLEGLGKITKPDGKPPTPQGRNWLYSGFTASFTSPSRNDPNKIIEGRITQEWLLSGRRGWNEDIYGLGDSNEDKGEPLNAAK